MSKFKILYTHQKTKKRKVWQDGTLTLSSDNKTGTLKNDEQNIIGSVWIKKPVNVGDDLESPKYLIQIDEICTTTAENNNVSLKLDSPDSTVNLEDNVVKQKRPQFRRNGLKKKSIKVGTNVSTDIPDSGEAFMSEVPKKKKKFSVPRRVGASAHECDSTSFGEPPLDGDDEYGDLQCVVVQQDENGIWHTVAHNQSTGNSDLNSTNQTLNGKHSEQLTERSSKKQQTINKPTKSDAILGAECNSGKNQKEVKLIEEKHSSLHHGDKTDSKPPTDGHSQPIRTAKDILEILKKAKNKSAPNPLLETEIFNDKTEILNSENFTKTNKVFETENSNENASDLSKVKNTREGFESETTNSTQKIDSDSNKIGFSERKIIPTDSDVAAIPVRDDNVLSNGEELQEPTDNVPQQTKFGLLIEDEPRNSIFSIEEDSIGDIIPDFSLT